MNRYEIFYDDIIRFYNERGYNLNKNDILNYEINKKFNGQIEFKIDKENKVLYCAEESKNKFPLLTLFYKDGESELELFIPVNLKDNYRLINEKEPELFQKYNCTYSNYLEFEDIFGFKLYKNNKEIKLFFNRIEFDKNYKDFLKDLGENEIESKYNINGEIIKNKHKYYVKKNKVDLIAKDIILKLNENFDKRDIIKKALVNDVKKVNSVKVFYPEGIDEKNITNKPGVYTLDLELYQARDKAKVKVLNNYKVNFYSNNKKIFDKEICENDKINKPAEPTKENYKFVGWYTDKELTKEYDFNEVVNEDLNLYAKWEENEKVKVVFHSNGGSKIEDVNIFV